jgi:hypothetical protein
MNKIGFSIVTPIMTINRNIELSGTGLRIPFIHLFILKFAYF